jgi:hypothetical protein
LPDDKHGKPGITALAVPVEDLAHGDDALLVDLPAEPEDAADFVGFERGEGDVDQVQGLSRRSIGIGFWKDFQLNFAHVQSGGFVRPQPNGARGTL